MIFKLAFLAVSFLIGLNCHQLKEKNVVDKWLNDVELAGLSPKERFETICRGNIDLIKSPTITRKQYAQWLDKCYPKTKRDEEALEERLSVIGIYNMIEHCKLYGGIVQEPSREEISKFLERVAYKKVQD